MFEKLVLLLQRVLLIGVNQIMQQNSVYGHYIIAR